MSIALCLLNGPRRLACPWVRWSVTALAAAIVLLAESTVYADCHKAYAICEGVKVTGFIAYATDSSYYVLIDGDLQVLPPLCTPHAGTLLRLRTHEVNWREMYATLLLAKAQNSKIDIRMDPDDPICSIAYVVLK